MGAVYEVWLRRPEGTAMQILETYEGLQYALLTNDISACRVVLPGGVYNRSLFAPDFRLEIWRQPEGRARQREGVWLIRKRKEWTDGSGKQRLEVTGYSPEYLLKGRIVAYAAASAYAKKENLAYDNIMKDVVNENLSGGATDTARQLASTYLSVQADLTQAPVVVNIAFAWRNVFDVLKDLAEASEGAGTDLFFSMEPLDSTKFEFRTHINQPGRDHTYPNGNPPVLLGMEYGNLAEPSLEEDWSDEANYVYAAGQGEEDLRTQKTAEDTTRSGRSIFGRREIFADARDLSNPDAVQSRAYTVLSQGKPKLRFKAKILDVPGNQYGVHWRHGDRVSAMYTGLQFDSLVRSVQVWVDQNGHETITTRLETEE